MEPSLSATTPVKDILDVMRAKVSDKNMTTSDTLSYEDRERGFRVVIVGKHFSHADMLMPGGWG